MTRRRDLMRVRLVRKLADRLDGIDVSGYVEGDVMDLPRAQALLLVAERWALPFRGPSRDVRAMSTPHERMMAADRRRAVEQLRRAREEIDGHGCERQERRRAEDRLREELHDSSAIVLNDFE